MNICNLAASCARVDCSNSVAENSSRGDKRYSEIPGADRRRFEIICPDYELVAMAWWLVIAVYQGQPVRSPCQSEPWVVAQFESLSSFSKWRCIRDAETLLNTSHPAPATGISAHFQPASHHTNAAPIRAHQKASACRCAAVANSGARCPRRYDCAASRLKHSINCSR